MRCRGSCSRQATSTLRLARVQGTTHCRYRGRFPESGKRTIWWCSLVRDTARKALDSHATASHDRA